MSSSPAPSDAAATEGKVAVVTGASSGIGEATARMLASSGWHCILVARRRDRLQAIAAEIGAEVEVCDVGDREAVDAMAARVLERHPAINLLVNNAGMPGRGTILTIEPELVRRVTEVNYLGGVWCTRAFLPGLRWAASAGGGAHVVNIVSVAGTVAGAAGAAYSASKHAQLAFSRFLVSTLRGSGIAVHTILPGFVETESFPQKGVLRSRLLGRFVIQPSRVAETVLKAIEKGRSEVTVPWFPYRPASVLQALAPGLVGRFAGMTGHRPGSV